MRRQTNADADARVAANDRPFCASRAAGPGGHARCLVDTNPEKRLDGRRDPRGFPHSYTYETGQDGPAALAAVTVERHQVRMMRQLPSGVPLSVTIPTHMFQAVAARMPGPAGGTLRITLELAHHDPTLSVPLAHADNLEDVVADWQSWAKAFHLPMALVEADGTLVEMETRIGPVRINAPCPRRRRFMPSRPRIRFLARRKMGNPTRAADIAPAALAREDS